MFRISTHADSSVDVETVEQIEAAVRAGKPGRYHVDEIRPNDDLFPSGHSSRPWGTAIHHPDGRVALKRFFYGDHVAADDDSIPPKVAVGARVSFGCPRC
jgi:hypothetical protein